MSDQSCVHITAIASVKHPKQLGASAGARQNVAIVTHGPFIGETHADLVRMSRAYAEDRMPRVSELG